MNSLLPTGIESYLKEAGFSATEMLVLRKLVEEESLTLRELASKTGKSTGVLDQAMKKLLNKQIAKRGTINGQPRYSIQSLDAVVRWVKSDMQQRKDMLDRRHQNFEDYVASLKIDKKRPDMEHFSGEEGIKKAYEKLLEAGKELLTLTPVLYSAEDDPLRAFRVEYFRKRQVRKIFQRVLAPDTPLARRFQSRDPFEYRKTLLQPEADLPLGFEKTVAGDMVVCINFQEQSASLLRYPDLAGSERAAFENLWNRQLAAERGEVTSAVTPASAAAPVVVPLKTRIFSSFREFVLGPRSIVALCLFALLAGGITLGLYQTNREQNIQRLKDKVMAIAITGALQFDARDIEAVRTIDDVAKPEYAKLVSILNLIRRSNADIQYAYLMRPSEDPAMWEFVADADSIDPRAKIDLNHDGVIDESDALNYPGELYDPAQFPDSADTFRKPLAIFGEDQWGSFLSGSSPIYDESGNVVAIIGIDVFTSQIDELSSETFTPLYAFIGLFIFFGLIRYGATNRSLLEECWQATKINTRKIVLWIIVVLVLAGSAIYGFHWYTYRLLVEETGKRLMSIAATTAGEFDPADLDQLHFARDMRTEVYQKVFMKLNEIRNKNQIITYAYILRPLEDTYLLEFVAEADANYNLPSYSKYKISDFAPFGESDEMSWTGMVYDDSRDQVFLSALRRPSYRVSFDQWGAFVAGCAPIFNNGQTAAILCVDRQLDLL